MPLGVKAVQAAGGKDVDPDVGEGGLQLFLLSTKAPEAPQAS